MMMMRRRICKSLKGVSSGCSLSHCSRSHGLPRAELKIDVDLGTAAGPPRAGGMKGLLVAVLVAAGICCSVSSALRCHYCMDSKNDQECNKQEPISCTVNRTVCIASLNVNTGLLSKGCASSNDCSIEYKILKTKCCTGDLCNAKLEINSGLMVTHDCPLLLLLLAALTALLHELAP